MYRIVKISSENVQTPKNNINSLKKKYTVYRKVTRLDDERIDLTPESDRSAHRSRGYNVRHER